LCEFSKVIKRKIQHDTQYGGETAADVYLSGVKGIIFAGVT